MYECYSCLGYYSDEGKSLSRNFSEWVLGQFEFECPINFSLSAQLDELKLIEHQTDPLLSECLRFSGYCRLRIEA